MPGLLLKPPGYGVPKSLEKELKMLVNYIRTALALKTDKRAVTAIEYALIAALIAVVIIGAVSLLGTSISSTFNKVSSEL
jgi:pilus assembly protein Flp/PilA